MYVSTLLATFHLLSDFVVANQSFLPRGALTVGK